MSARTSAFVRVWESGALLLHSIVKVDGENNDVIKFTRRRERNSSRAHGCWKEGATGDYPAIRFRCPMEVNLA